MIRKANFDWIIYCGKLLTFVLNTEVQKQKKLLIQGFQNFPNAVRSSIELSKKTEVTADLQDSWTWRAVAIRYFGLHFQKHQCMYSTEV